MGERQSASGLRLLGQLTGAAVVWITTLVVATRVLRQQPASQIVRGVMVALGTFGFIPLLWTLALTIRSQDEFSRRLHVLALAVAFGALAVCLVAADLLQQAGFIDYLPLTTIWMGMIVLWWLSLVTTTRYFR